MMKVYRGNNRVFWVVTVLWMLISLIDFIPPWTFRSILLTLIEDLVFALIVLGYTIGTYITLDQEMLLSVSSFIFRDHVPVRNVVAIKSQLKLPLIHSLYLFYSDSNGVVRKFDLVPISFQPATLGEFFFDLKRRNPRIELDASAKTFVERYESSKIDKLNGTS